MQSNAATVKEYLQEIPGQRRGYFNQLREVMLANLPDGFVEQIPYDLIAELMQKMTVDDWIHAYEASVKR